MRESRFEPRPFTGRDDSRHEVERNEALGPCLFAIHGERDADAMEDAFGLAAFLRNAIRRRALEPVRESPVMGPQYAVRRVHFIKSGG